VCSSDLGIRITNSSVTMGVGGNLSVPTYYIQSYIDGNYINGTTNISGNTNIFGNAYVSGNATVTGNLTATTVTSTSDYRLKKDITPISLDNYSIDKLNPVEFKYKSDEIKTLGFLAHELQEEIPILVTGNKDDDEYQSVNYIGLIPLLVKEIQELKRKLDELTN